MTDIQLYYQNTDSLIKSTLEKIHPDWLSEPLIKYKKGSNTVVVVDDINTLTHDVIRRYIRDNVKVYVEGCKVLEDIEVLLEHYSDLELQSIVFVFPRFIDFGIYKYKITDDRTIKIIYFPYSYLQVKEELKNYDYKADRPFQSIDYLGSVKFNINLRDKLYYRGVYRKLKVYSELDIDQFSKAKVVLLNQMDDLCKDTWYAIASGTPFVNVEVNEIFTRAIHAHRIGDLDFIKEVDTLVDHMEVEQKIAYAKRLYDKSDDKHVLAISQSNRNDFFTSDISDTVGRFFTRFLFDKKTLL